MITHDSQYVGGYGDSEVRFCGIKRGHYQVFDYWLDGYEEQQGSCESMEGGDGYTAGGWDDPYYTDHDHVLTISECEDRCNEDHSCTAFTWMNHH